MRKLIVCCDGTWNEPEEDGKRSKDRSDTNVVTLSNAIAIRDCHDNAQLVHYQKGVGTTVVWRLAGGALGVGISEDIRQCYEFLCREYLNEDDQIFLFGFSRGAYAARSLGGLIVQCGLLKIVPEESNSNFKRRAEDAYDSYKKGQDAVQEFRESEETHDNVSIEFLGVWDTVGALGIPDHLFLNKLDRREHFQFHDTRLSQNVKTARHAVAIDEMRESYTPTLWVDAHNHPDAKEVWFAGVHSNIGGGYADESLGNITLNWMMNQAADNGLVFKSDFTPPEEDPSGMLHDSADSKFWRKLGLRPRGIPRISDEKKVHASVRKRQSDVNLSPRYRIERQLVAGTTAVTVESVERWNNTGFYLEKGQVYEFKAEGTWRDASRMTDADGFKHGGIAHWTAQAIEGAMGLLRKKRGFHEVRLPFTRRVPDYNWFSLVGVIANENVVPGEQSARQHETFLIGNGTVYTAKDSGYLYCFANDTWQTYERNNNGSIDLTVTHRGKNMRPTY
ncbi:MAG: DUF2235 domain-containing protein [Stappiaceae bacterium]|uniref:DUF2235 domain-containing protein n=1 Tax=Roseibium sp. TaxID=1936156 RepID=UPI003298C51C